VRAFVEAGGYGGTPVVGLGVDELRWLKPVRAGDVLTVQREIVELRRSASSPGHGIVKTRVTVRNQAGEAVMSLLSAG
jgi:acyl dehydratase